MLKRSVLYSLRILMIVAVGGSLWLVGLILFTRLIPSSTETFSYPTDGIVVFTGGKTRLQVALTLFEENKGNYLLISGVNPESTFSEITADSPNKSRITLGYSALDTVGNVKETAAWVLTHQIKTLRLITSNYHMPRSLLELRQELPHVYILPHAVVGEPFLQQKWWLNPDTLHLVIQEYNKFLFALMRGPFEDIQGFFSFEAQK